MAQGRGSARAGGNGAAVLALVLLCVLLHGEFAESAVYTVGDRGGWTLNSGGWPRGKRFRAGDVLRECSAPSLYTTVLTLFCLTFARPYIIRTKRKFTPKELMAPLWLN